MHSFLALSKQKLPTRLHEDPKFECGGGCALSTAGDYLRFAWMLVNKGSYGDTRVLGRKMVEYMLANHLSPDVRPGITGPLYAGYGGFGLGVAVRVTPGIVPTPGSVGDFSWNGAYGTSWWGDPQEQLAVVWMAHTPGDSRIRFRNMIRTLVNQAIID